MKELEIFSLALFFALAVAGAMNQHDPQGFLQRYHNGLAVGALACFAVASLAFKPFTEGYAEELVQRKYWNTHRFSRANVELTLMWAAVFVAIAGSQITAGVIETRLGATIFNWVLPVALILARGPPGDASVVRSVRRRIDGARRDAQPGRALGPPARTR